MFRRLILGIILPQAPLVMKISRKAIFCASNSGHSQDKVADYDYPLQLHICMNFFQ